MPSGAAAQRAAPERRGPGQGLTSVRERSTVRLLFAPRRPRSNGAGLPIIIYGVRPLLKGVLVCGAGLLTADGFRFHLLPAIVLGSRGRDCLAALECARRRDPVRRRVHLPCFSSQGEVR